MLLSNICFAALVVSVAWASPCYPALRGTGSGNCQGAPLLAPASYSSIAGMHELFTKNALLLSVEPRAPRSWCQRVSRGLQITPYLIPGPSTLPGPPLLAPHRNIYAPQYIVCAWKLASNVTSIRVILRVHLDQNISSPK